MFQKPVHDAAHRDVFAQTRHARTQAADAANDEVNFHARLGRGVKGLDQLRFNERVELGDDARRQAALRIGRFARDELQQPGVQVKRGHDEFFHALKLADAGKQVEQVRRVLAKFRPARQQAQVRVKLRRVGVVVAGAEVNITADFVPLAADHQGALGVNFVADQTINHMDAVFLQLPRPLDVVRLVKPGAEFDHHGDLLAVVHRAHQRAENARITARAIERHFDGQHVAVGGGAFEKFHHAGIIFVGMMQQDVAFADGGKHICLVAQGRSDWREERRIAQFRRMAALIQHHQPRRVHRAVHQITILLGQVEGFAQRLADLFGAAGGNLQPHGVAAPASM